MARDAELSERTLEDGPVERSPGLMKAAWIATVLVWLLTSWRPDTGEGAAYQAGAVTGTLVFSFLIAALIRWGYLKMTKKNWLWRVWSPWLFVIAIVINLFALAGYSRAGRLDSETRDVTADLIRAEGGQPNANLESCVAGGLDSYDATPANDPTRTQITRRQMGIIMARACLEYERRGYMEKDEPPPPEVLRPVITQIVADMQASGEL